MYKVVGNAHITTEEMEEVLLDIAVTLNNWPQRYVDDDIEQFKQSHNPEQAKPDNQFTRYRVWRR